MLELTVMLLLAADPAGSPADAGVANAAAPAPAEAEATPPPQAGASDGGPTLAPELTTDGLEAELLKSAREHKSEREAIATERAKLLKLAQDIDTARKLLRQETDALREKLRSLPEQSEVPASALAANPQGAAPGAPTTPTKSSIDALAKTLKGMKPQQAAQVLTRVDRGLAVELLGQIKPNDRGEILDQMKPEEAAQLIAAMAPKERKAAAP